MNNMYKAKLRDWSGVSIREEFRDNGVERCIRRLERNPDKYATYEATGNNIVVVFRNDGDTGPHTYEVYDCIIRRSDVLEVNEYGEIVNHYKNTSEDV